MTDTATAYSAAVPRHLITIQAAAFLVHRSPSRVYTWVREDRLCSWTADGHQRLADGTRPGEGTLLVDEAEVLELEARMRRRRNNTTRTATVATAA